MPNLTISVLVFTLSTGLEKCHAVRSVMIRVAISLVLLATCLPASRAEICTGNRLLDGAIQWLKKDKLTTHDGKKIGAAEHFHGYVTGCAESPDILPYLPSKTETVQLADIVAKYIVDHPEERHLSGYELVFKACADAFDFFKPPDASSEK